MTPCCYRLMKFIRTNCISQYMILWQTSLQTSFLLTIKMHIQRLLHDDEMRGQDVSVWKDSSSGMFSSKSFFKYLFHDQDEDEHGHWLWLWRLHCLLKMKNFVWLIVHGRLPTNARHTHLSSQIQISVYIVSMLQK